MYIIPDELLEMNCMKCDSCQKFLSVGPVNVYRNKKTLCGRCCSEADDGVVSLYNSLAEQGIFKCINRFDGCRKLLGYSQVADHENSCESKSYLCPICSETVPTFLMIKHFKETHREHYLLKHTFQVDHCCPDTKKYLYQVRDNLFFIECKNVTMTEFGLSTFLLGSQKAAKKMKQNFVVDYFNNGYVRTATLPCNSLVCEGYEFITFEKPLVECSVALELRIKENSDFIPILVDNVKPEQKKTGGMMRNISLGWGFQKDHPKFSVESAFLRVGSSLIHPYCHNCSLPTAASKNYLEVKPRKYLPICGICEKNYLRKSPEMKFTDFKGIHEISPENHIEYSCIWGCTQTCRSDIILQHENKCPYQPKRSCPVRSCTYQISLINLEEHFQKIHPQDRISLLPKFSICTSNAFHQKWYVWIQDAFHSIDVYVQETIPGNKYNWTVAAESLGLRNTLQPDLKLMIYSEFLLYNDPFEKGIYKFYSYRNDTVRFLCYFEANHPF